MLEIEADQDKSNRDRDSQVHTMNKREELNQSMHLAELDLICNYYEEKQAQLISDFQRERIRMEQQTKEREKLIMEKYHLAMDKKMKEAREMREAYEKR